MSRIFFLILFFFSSASYAQDDYLMVKKALGFVNEFSQALISVVILHSSRIDDNYYALVYVEQYTNGVCAPRGYCGCGIDKSYVSLSLNKSEKVNSKEVITYSCKSNLQHHDSEYGNITAILVDDIDKSCDSPDKMSGMSFYLYLKFRSSK